MVNHDFGDMTQPDKNPVQHQSSRPTGKVLGVTLDLHDYDSAWLQLQKWASEDAIKLVAAANTHLVGEAASDDDFANVLSNFDMVLPDGMPLVWSMQLDGYPIHDRVYGPYIMRHALAHSGPDVKHYFFGGTEECLDKLCEQARKLNPVIHIVGTTSPPFGKWDEEIRKKLINNINEANPDMIWVALGGVRQERWLFENRHLFKRGVYLAVGDAFVLNAGLRAYAPHWMQRAGLTWLFRLVQEPSRLLRRYLTYNARFVVAFVKERWSKTWSS